MKKRRTNLSKFASELGCDTLISFEPENLFYMTDFWGEAIGILEKGGKTTIIAPELEVGRAKEESVDCDVITSERGGLLSSLTKKVKKGKACTDCQNYHIMQSLKKNIPKIKNSLEPFQRARIIKDEKEISALKKGSRIIDNMFELCSNQIRPGMRESELQAILMGYAIKHEMFDTGYKSTLNPLIIAGGANGSLPHAQVTKRKFKKGDLIVVDLTLRYKGYVSDATRTFGISKVSDNDKQIYDIVKESQKLGLKNVKPKKTCSSVDAACRNYIDKEGYGNYFIHSTGHGIGLDVHEKPTISQKSTEILSNNMAITVEPGIYIPNKSGVRIEDSVIVKNKPLLLHKFTKDLIVV